MNHKYFDSDKQSVIGNNKAIEEYERTTGRKLKAISLVAWHSTHNDYKGVSSGWNPDLPTGIPTVMDYDQGTCLVCVKVVRDNEAVAERVAELQAQRSGQDDQ